MCIKPEIGEFVFHYLSWKVSIANVKIMWLMVSPLSESFLIVSIVRFLVIKLDAFKSL